MKSAEKGNMMWISIHFGRTNDCDIGGIGIGIGEFVAAFDSVE